VFSSLPPDGIPFHNAYMFERSEKGHVILPADWDDSEDDVYDQYAK
jgi:DNA-damage-inducible protein J